MALPNPVQAPPALTSEVAWVRRRIDMIGAGHAWTEEHVPAVCEFLRSPTFGRLFVYMDSDDRLHCSTAFPSKWTKVLVFVRDTTRKVNSDNIHELIQCEVISGSPGECMLRLMQVLYLPAMLDDGHGQPNVTKDFVGELDRFMAKLTESLFRTKGKTVLYVPPLNLDGDARTQSKDKYLIQRLESIVIRWTRQIKEVVRGQDRIAQMEASGPLAEIEFWRQRSLDLGGIGEQINRTGVSTILMLLQHLKSPYLETFASLSNKIDHEAVVAAENVKFLTVLEQPCWDLATSKLSDVPFILPVLLQCIRMIWKISPYYNTVEKITGLLCKVTNEIISRCSAEFPLIEIFEGDVERCKIALEESIEACESWKRIYNTMMDSNSSPPLHVKPTLETLSGITDVKKSIDSSGLGTRSIFAPVEAFLQRCHDMLEVCDSRSQFSPKLKLPAFGGTRGWEVTKSMLEMRQTFHKLLCVLKSLPYNLLDVKVTRWHDDYNQFKDGVKDLEVMMQNIMSMAFRYASSLSESIELVEAFKLMARRHSICLCVERMSSQICAAFSTELIIMKKHFDQLRKRPLMDSSFPRYAGVALLALQIRHRLKEPMMLLTKAVPYLLDTAEGSELGIQYDQISSSIDQFIQGQHMEWMNSLDPSAMKKLEGSILDDGGDGSYAVRFDPSFLGLFYEVRYWRRLRWEIPEMAADFLESHDGLKILRDNILSLIRDCNKILGSMDLEEKGLAAYHVNKLVSCIQPGLDKVEGSIETALRSTVARSLQELSNVLNADSKASSPMFNAILVLEKNSGCIKTTPSIQELLDVIQKVCKELIAVISVVPHLREQGMNLQGIVNTSVGLLSSGQSALRSFYEIISMDQEEVLMTIKDAILGITYRIQQYVIYWEKKYKSVWDQDKDVYIRRYERAKKPLSAFDSDITKYKNLQDNVQAEDMITSIRFMRIDCGPLKQSIISHCECWINKFTTLLNYSARTELEDIYSYIERNTKELRRHPENLDMLTEIINHWHNVLDECPTVESRFEPLQEKYKLLLKFEVTIPEAEKILLDKLPTEWEAFRTMLLSLEKDLEQAKKGFYDFFSVMVKSFSKEVCDSRAQFVERIPTTSATTTDDALRFIEEEHAKIELFQKKAQSLWAGMSIFGMEKMSNKENAATLKDLDLLKSMWMLKKEWEVSFDSLKDGLFSELDTASMESSAAVFSKRLFKIGRETKGWGVWNDLKDTIDAFKSTLPLTVDLRNPALRPHHWEQLMENVGQKFDPYSHEFTLNKVAELRLDLHATIISELSIAASKELAIEESLVKIKQTWENLDLDIVSYREVPKIYKLRNTEDVFTVLEEHRIILSSMKSNRAHLHFSKEIDKWEERLCQISDAIEIIIQVRDCVQLL